jgi:tight adherence protein C
MRGRSRLAVVGLPLSLDLFVLAVRAGFGPSLAVGAVMPYLPEPYRAAFAEVDRRIRLGERFTDAIARLPDLVGAVAQPMTDALVTATRYGHPLAPVLDQLSRDARQVRRRQADIDARRLPIRLSFPLVVCVLPGFALVSVVPLLGGTLSSLRLTG